MPSDLNNLYVDLGKAAGSIYIEAKKIIAKGGQDVVRDAQAFCPVRTGNLKNSISVDYGANGLSFEAGPTMNYGMWVECGTSRMAPRAFLGPAFDRNVPQIVGELDRLGGKVI